MKFRIEKLKNPLGISSVFPSCLIKIIDSFNKEIESSYSSIKRLDISPPLKSSEFLDISLNLTERKVTMASFMILTFILQTKIPSLGKISIEFDKKLFKRMKISQELNQGNLIIQNSKNRNIYVDFYTIEENYIKLLEIRNICPEICKVKEKLTIKLKLINRENLYSDFGQIQIKAYSNKNLLISYSNVSIDKNHFQTVFPLQKIISNRQNSNLGDFSNYSFNFIIPTNLKRNSIINIAIPINEINLLNPLKCLIKNNKGVFSTVIKCVNTYKNNIIQIFQDFIEKTLENYNLTVILTNVKNPLFLKGFQINYYNISTIYQDFIIHKLITKEEILTQPQLNYKEILEILFTRENDIINKENVIKLKFKLNNLLKKQDKIWIFFSNNFYLIKGKNIEIKITNADFTENKIDLIIKNEVEITKEILYGEEYISSIIIKANTLCLNNCNDDKYIYLLIKNIKNAQFISNIKEEKITIQSINNVDNNIFNQGKFLLPKLKPNLIKNCLFNRNNLLLSFPVNLTIYYQIEFTLPNIPIILLIKIPKNELILKEIQLEIFNNITGKYLKQFEIINKEEEENFTIIKIYDLCYDNSCNLKPVISLNITSFNNNFKIPINDNLFLLEILTFNNELIAKGNNSMSKIEKKDIFDIFVERNSNQVGFLVNLTFSFKFNVNAGLNSGF